MRGKLPDAEKTENVVHAHGAEVALEVRHPPAPPLVPVLAHDVPVVRGEAPVLAVRVERVGGGARARAHAEQLGMHPRVHRGFVHADGQVALQHHAPRRRERARAS